MAGKAGESASTTLKGGLVQKHKTGIKNVYSSIEFSNGFRRAIFFTLIVLYFVSLGYDPVKVTALMGVSRIILAIFTLPTGAFADYYSRKKSTLISFFLMALSFYGFYIFRDFWLLGACYILHDIGFSFQSGATAAWAIDSLAIGGQKNAITLLFSRVFFFERMGAILGGFVGFVVVGIEFKLVWLLIAIFNILMLAGLYFLMKEEGKYDRKDKRRGKSLAFASWGQIARHTFRKTSESLKYLFGNKEHHLRGLAFGIVTASITIESMALLSPLFLAEQHALMPNVISGIASITSVVLVGATLLAPYAIRKGGFRASLGYSFVFMGIAILAFAVVHQIVVAIIALIVASFLDFFGGIVSQSAMHHEIPSGNRATLGSTLDALWSVTVAIAAGFVSLGLLFFGIVVTTALLCVFAFMTAGIYFVTLSRS